MAYEHNLEQWAAGRPLEDRLLAAERASEAVTRLHRSKRDWRQGGVHRDGMNLTLVTLPFDPVVGAFPAEPLAGIDGEVVNVVEHFFPHGGLPWLLIVVHHRPVEVTRRQRPDRTGELEPAAREVDEVGRQVGGWARHAREAGP